MCIRKRSKNNKTSSLRRLRLLILALVCLLSAANTGAEFSVGMRVMPGYYIPIGETVLHSGPGAAAVVDFHLFPAFSVFVQGEYVSITLENLSPLILTDASAGATATWRPHDRWSLFGELFGGVYSVSQEEEVRSGISAGARTGATYHISPAFSASLSGTFRHYAYTPKPFMNAVSVSAAVSVNLTELISARARMSGEKAGQDPVFPVFYSWYNDNPFATVRITNEEKTSITDVRTSFYLEKFMGQPKLCSVTRTVAPGETVEVPVRAFFNEGMLDLIETIEAEGKIIVEYRTLGSDRVKEIPVTLQIQHRNAMNWQDDRRAAAFVSPRDPASMWFSRYVSSVVSNRFRPGVNRNMQYAAGVFESLNTFGLNYVIDPTSAYVDNSETGSIDFLQFPYQTLMYRGGDCDDLSILFCSLLESIGIDTAFVTVPGHIFMAFSSGMTEEEARREFYAPDELVYHDGMAWVPVEITLTKEGFAKAWRIGAKQWNDASALDKADLYPLKDAWTVYQPVSVPGAVSRFTLPDENRTMLAFDASLDVLVEREIRPQIIEYRRKLAVNDNRELRNRLGVLYGKYGMLDHARREFTIAAQRGSRHARVNLGNIGFLEGDYSAALDSYNRVLSSEPGNSLALLGAARCYYELDDYDRSDTLYAELGTRDTVLVRNYAYLGSFFDTRGRAWNFSDRLSTMTWSLDEPDAPLLLETGHVANKDAEPVMKSGGLAADLMFRLPEPSTPEKPAVSGRDSDGTGFGTDGDSQPAVLPVRREAAVVGSSEDEDEQIDEAVLEDEPELTSAAESSETPVEIAAVAVAIPEPVVDTPAPAIEPPAPAVETTAPVEAAEEPADTVVSDDTVVSVESAAISESPLIVESPAPAVAVPVAETTEAPAVETVEMPVESPVLEPVAPAPEAEEPTPLPKPEPAVIAEQPAEPGVSSDVAGRSSRKRSLFWMAGAAVLGLLVLFRFLKKRKDTDKRKQP